MITPKRKKMTLHEIKTMLYRRKIKPAQAAEVTGVSHITVCTVLNGFRTSHKIKQAVAHCSDKAYEKLWGTDPHHNRGILSDKKRVVNG